MIIWFINVVVAINLFFLSETDSPASTQKSLNKDGELGVIYSVKNKC